MFNLINEKKVFYFDIKKSLFVIGEYPPQYYELLRFKLNVKTVAMLDNKKGEISYRFRIDSVYFKGKKEKEFFSQLIPLLIFLLVIIIFMYLLS